MLKTLVKPFIALAALGLALSIWVHLGALLKLPNPFGEAVWALHGGIFVVWLPAVLAMQRMMRNEHVKQKDMWKVVLKGCPAWMRTMTYGLFGYALVNFIAFMATTRLGPAKGTTPEVLRGFSGHWMAFYSAALATLYSATRQVEAKCGAGHEASPAAKYCDQCGAPVLTTVDGQAEGS